jgi:hypothetical protein
MLYRAEIHGDIDAMINRRIMRPCGFNPQVTGHHAAPDPYNHHNGIADTAFVKYARPVRSTSSIRALNQTLAHQKTAVGQRSILGGIVGRTPQSNGMTSIYGRQAA